MTNFASVLLLRDVKTEQGTKLKQGAFGTLVEPFGDDFVVEFALEDEIVETAVLSPDTFAITEILKNTPTATE